MKRKHVVVGSCYSISESLHKMNTRDVVSSSATILGLIITAFGIIVTLGRDSNQIIVKNFAFVFIIIVILFVCSVIITTISSILDKERLWTCALIVYIIGWASLGTTMILTLLGYAYGIEMFQIQMEQYDSEVVSIITIIVGGVTGVLMSFTVNRLKRYLDGLIERSKKLNVETSEIEHDGIILQKESRNIRQELIILRTEIERETRKLANLNGSNNAKETYYRFSEHVRFLKNKNIIDNNLGNTLLFIYRRLSKVVHGENISIKESELLLEIGLKTLTSVRKLIEKTETN